MQRETNLKFDLTCDCEDGAQLGDEIQHAKMISKVIKNTEIEKQRVGVRVPEIKNKNWKKIANHLIGECGDKLSYITIPKVDSYKEAAIGIEYGSRFFNKCF